MNKNVEFMVGFTNDRITNILPNMEVAEVNLVIAEII